MRLSFSQRSSTYRDILDIKVTDSRRKMHRFIVPADLGFYSFKEEIGKLYELSVLEYTHAMYFKDEDGDKILLESQEDWQLALLSAKKHSEEEYYDDCRTKYFLRIFSGKKSFADQKTNDENSLYNWITHLLNNQTVFLSYIYTFLTYYI
ncbi:hypothetical protein BDB00DRAFT_330543 [Zychaea mexicana]|uniref:uncharacterized protein n=1 Tax=Zychaea mexicana TaxID=64656 RepID=UPI0022FE3E85|nr:uncharacterized protein BDB00DRAFT_330543 [Zychaea mexicana]KAI9499011.1 hypothetical protein BDB00DRAFT_330543 [Zychaea mexicana]